MARKGEPSHLVPMNDAEMPSSGPEEERDAHRPRRPVPVREMVAATAGTEAPLREGRADEASSLPAEAPGAGEGRGDAPAPGDREEAEPREVSFAAAEGRIRARILGRCRAGSRPGTVHLLLLGFYTGEGEEDTPARETLAPGRHLSSFSPPELRALWSEATPSRAPWTPQAFFPVPGKDRRRGG